MKLIETLTADLERRRSEHLYRSRLTLDSPQGREVRVRGNAYLNFCSNDYLGLANHPEIKAAFISAAQQYGCGSGASHLVNGHSRLHQQLEEALADFTGRDRALLFSTGYMANLGVITALLGAGDAVFEDRLNHASLLDGGRLSGAIMRRYRHADCGHLQQLLERANAGTKLVASDGLFSMDGDLAPLEALVKISSRAGAWLMLDDAHGFGCLGEHGGGTAAHFGYGQDELPILVGTLGKAFGTSGAFVAGPQALIETLIQRARTYIYTTAMPAAIAGASLASLERVRGDTWRREKLAALVARFRAGAEQCGLTLMPSLSPIQPLPLGSCARALEVSATLMQQGILVTAIRPPTVPEGGARLRITFSAGHQEADVDRLLSALEQSLK